MRIRGRSRPCRTPSACTIVRSPRARSAARRMNRPRMIFDGSHWRRSRRPALSSTECGPAVRSNDMATLPLTEAEKRIKSLNGWTLDGQSIRKQFTFAGFPEAVAFVNRLVPDAEAADHHPDILIN